MGYFSALRFVSKNMLIVYSVLFGLLLLGIALLVRRHKRTSIQKMRRQDLAACWRATLSELSVALDRMQETTRRLIRDRQEPSRLERVYKSDISTHRWLREGFLLMAGTQAEADLVKSLNADCEFFLWNVNQTTKARVYMLGATDATHLERAELQKSIDGFDNATIEFACNRHHEMVRDWKKSAGLLTDFCCQNELEPGVALAVPTEFPIKWQRDEKKSWTFEDLARVGEDKWEP